jgi:hypothetical protein
MFFSLIAPKPQVSLSHGRKGIYITLHKGQQGSLINPSASAKIYGEFIFFILPISSQLGTY